MEKLANRAHPNTIKLVQDVKIKRLDTLIRSKGEMKKVSQADLCKSAGITQVTLSHIENGRLLTNIDTMVRLYDALGYDLKAVPKEESEVSE